MKTYIIEFEKTYGPFIEVAWTAYNARMQALGRYRMNTLAFLKVREPGPLSPHGELYRKYYGAS